MIGITQLDLDAFTLWPRNYHVGDVQAIKASILAFGFNAAVRVRNEASGDWVAYAGNHSIKALREIKEAGLPAPKGIEVVQGVWLVPVLSIDHLTPEQAQAFAIADNRTASLGQIDEAQLNQLLAEILEQDVEMLLATGYRLSDLTPELPEVDNESTGKEFADRAAELQEKWLVTQGDVFKIGPHRLMCGDSENDADIQRLTGGLKAKLMVTDPPYGVKYDSDWRAEYSSGEYSVGTIENDDRAEWTDVWQKWGSQVLYVWHGALHAHTVHNSLTAANYEVRAQIIWNKSCMVFSRGAYHWKHEPCWYSVKKGSTANWQGDRSQTTVWDCGNGSAVGRTGDESDDFHAGHISQKPVELFRRAILNHTEPGDVVHDAFAGSGSCLIACHATQRVCQTMELDPKFCAAILERCQVAGLEITKEE